MTPGDYLTSMQSSKKWSSITLGITFMLPCGFLWTRAPFLTTTKCLPDQLKLSNRPPEEELDNILVGIVLRVVESGVAAGVDAVDDGLHAMLDQHVVVAQQRVDRLLVHVAALVPVYQDLLEQCEI